MKFGALSVLVTVALLACAAGFRPTARKTLSSRVRMARGEQKVIDPNETEEELVERMRKKARKMMFNENGVAYAPWVSQQIDEDAIIKDLIKKEKYSAEGKNKKQTSILDRGEIVGSEGMKWRMSDSNVQLAWSTGGEANNQGFIVEKRPSYGGDFQEIGSYQEVGALKSAGAGGGKYVYTDPSSAAGSWIYRVQDCDDVGKQNVLCQCFVEVQTESENKAQMGVLVALVGILTAAAAAGSLLDPAMN